MPDPVYHIPALLRPTIEGLNIGEGVYVDATFGGGGHSRAILQALGTNGRLFGFDQDKDAYINRLDDFRFQFVHSNFRYLPNFMRYYGVTQINGLLADLGVSFHHFDTAERGFSFRFEGPLDMRMNRNGGKTAADIVNTYSEEQLAQLFYLYGELKNGKRLAHALVQQRAQSPLLQTEDLVQCVSPLCGRDAEKKDLAKVFQALRIEVNDEMGALHDLLDAARDLLAPQGRLVVLTYHSLEDRIVKNFMRAGNREGIVEKDFYGNPLTPFELVGKVITPTPEEIALNPRARSAKLRIAQKKGGNDGQ